MWRRKQLALGEQILVLVLGVCWWQLADVLGVLGAVGLHGGAVALHRGAARRHTGELWHRLPLEGGMTGGSRVMAGGAGAVAGGPGAVAGGLAAVAGSTGAHLSGESVKLSGGRDHPG